MTGPQQRRNYVGFAALGLAVLGLILAAIPATSGAGWVILPIALVAGVAGLLVAVPERWPATAAVAVAAVGTVLAVVLFFTIGSGSGSGGGSSNTASGDEAASVDSDPSPDSGTADDDADDDDSDDDAEGGRNNPVPFGTAFTIGDWEIELVSFDPDATEAVLAANQFNDEPDDGSVYAMVTATVTYRGNGSSSMGPLAFAFVTDSGNVYKDYDTNEVTPKPELEGELYAGASLTGNEIMTIPEGESGLIRVTVDYGEDETFFAVE